MEPFSTFPAKRDKTYVKIEIAGGEVSFGKSSPFFYFFFFLDQLCTCVYYLYIDSMMLFCGALHVSIGLCMSYRAS